MRFKIVKGSASGHIRQPFFGRPCRPRMFYRVRPLRQRRLNPIQALARRYEHELANARTMDDVYRLKQRLSEIALAGRASD